MAGQFELIEDASSTNGVNNGADGTVAGPQELAIQTQDIWRIYKLSGQEIHALRGVDLQIEPGQFISLKGRSGSGKTTLLNILGGLDQPSKGSVQIFGEEIDGWNERKLTNWRRHQVGFIFQSLGLLPTLSAYENVELILRMTGAKAKERKEVTMACLDLVGLTKWSGHRPYEMSGGQQQRVAIARALANSPRMIIADEPTGELDTNTATEILGLFQAIVKERGVTMLMATHDGLSDEFVDKVLHLKDGQILSAEEYHAIEEAERLAAIAQRDLNRAREAAAANGAVATAVPIIAPEQRQEVATAHAATANGHLPADTTPEPMPEPVADSSPPVDLSN